MNKEQIKKIVRLTESIVNKRLTKGNSDRRPVNEVFSPSFAALENSLHAAIIAARKVHADNNGTFKTHSSEGVEIASLLEKIWNAFSTGDPNNSSEADEIFK